MGIGTVSLAGCAGDDGTSADGTVSSTPEAGTDATAAVPYETFPDAETLLDGHFAALAERSFTATEYTEESLSSGRSAVTDTTLRSADAGALLEGDDVARNYGSASPQSVWFTDNARISRVTHTYNPDGITLPVVERSNVTSIAEISAFERASVSDDEAAAVAFEASGPSESAREDRTDYRSIDVRIAVTTAGFVRSIDAEVTFARNADAEETQTVIYRYAVSDVGETSVSAPDFVDDALRVRGDIASDGASVVLEHAGGPTVEPGTGLRFQDDDHGVVREYERPTFQSSFAEGDVAYVYWTGDETAAISVGDEPPSVARDIALPTEGDVGADVYLADRSGVGPPRFVVRIDRQA